MNIGNKIKELRKEYKLTQEQFAKKIGVTQDSISLWETNKRIPDTIYIVEICLKFNISSDYLLGIEDYDGTKINTKNYIHTLNNNGKIKF